MSEWVADFKDEMNAYIKTFQKKVTVIKTKKGIPTVIEVDGMRYIRQHENQYKRGVK